MCVYSKLYYFALGQYVVAVGKKSDAKPQLVEQIYH